MLYRASVILHPAHHAYRFCISSTQPKASIVCSATDSVRVLASAGVHPDVLRAVARDCVLQSAELTAALREQGIVLSVSPHVAVGKQSKRLDAAANIEAWLAASMQSMDGSAGRSADAVASGFASADGDDEASASQAAADRLAGAAPAVAGGASDGEAAREGSSLAGASGADDASSSAPAAVAVVTAQPAAPASGKSVLTEAFQDPLRFSVDSDAGSDAGREATAAEQAAGPPPAPAPLTPAALRGLELLTHQRLFYNMSSRNNRKALRCDPPRIYSDAFYARGDGCLAAFLRTLIPRPSTLCGNPACHDTTSNHVRTILHGNARITLSVAQLLPHSALPGDQNQIWTWLRSKHGDRPHLSRRIPLSPEAACLSASLFLQQGFCSERLAVAGHPLYRGFVRYFGIGNTAICLHQDWVTPHTVQLPPPALPYSMASQLMWLKHESAELCQEANEAFDIVELALQSQQQLAAAATGAAGAGGGVGGAAAPDGPLLSSPGTLLAAARKDRSCFMERVGACVQVGSFALAACALLDPFESCAQSAAVADGANKNDIQTVTFMNAALSL